MGRGFSGHGLRIAEGLFGHLLEIHEVIEAGYILVRVLVDFGIEDRGADAERKPFAQSLREDAVCEARTDAPHDLLELRLVRERKDGDEFVPRVARKEVVGTEAGPDELDGKDQGLVASRMAEAVVDQLEVVHVGEQAREAPASPSGADPLLAEIADARLDVLIQSSAIEGSREVVARQLAPLDMNEDHEQGQNRRRPYEDESEVSDLQGSGDDRRDGKGQQGRKRGAVDRPAARGNDDDDYREDHVRKRDGCEDRKKRPAVIGVTLVQIKIQTVAGVDRLNRAEATAGKAMKRIHERSRREFAAT